jgi:uncharacterized Zn-finger protein
METKLCRVCLDQTATISMFNAGNGISHSMKIMKCANICITEGDGLPDLICANCLSDLNTAYDFVLKCESSDKTLHANIVNQYTVADIKTEAGDIKEEILRESSYDSDIADETEKLAYCTNQFNTDSDALVIDYEPKKTYKKKLVKKKPKRTKSGPLQCVICGQTTLSRSAMETHMRTHTGEKPFTCKVCKSQFRTKGSLKRHFETRHSDRERKFTCEMCGSSFYRKNDIVIHMRVHTDERPYGCPYCSKRFRQIASLIRHKRIHTGEKPFGCPICGKKFSDKNLVKKHLTVHSDEKKYTCHLCNKSVKTRNALNTHMSLHTNEKQNICSFCGVAFSMKGNLQTHIRRVHSEKSGQCSVCLKTFSDLEVHMRKHTGERPFLCKLCDKNFATKRSLSHHMVFKHENAAKFKCSIGECTKTFPTAMMLEFHLLKQHTNNTPYICQHCSRGFFRTSDLSRHLRVSHMDSHIKMPLKSIDT